MSDEGKDKGKKVKPEQLPLPDWNDMVEVLKRDIEANPKDDRNKGKRSN